MLDMYRGKSNAKIGNVCDSFHCRGGHFRTQGVTSQQTGTLLKSWSRLPTPGFCNAGLVSIPDLDPGFRIAGMNDNTQFSGVQESMN